MKVVEFFRPHPRIDAGRALRVSRYLDGPEEQHVRVSVWRESDEYARAEAAISLDQSEAKRLADFLLGPTHAGRPRSLRETVRAVRDRAAAAIR
jgi:hypothetical protein